MKRLLIALLALGAAKSITPAMACLGYAPGSCVWVDTTSYGSWSATPALGAPGGYGGSLTFWGTTSGYATILPAPVAGNVKLTLPATAGTLAVSPLPLTSLSPEAANTVVANVTAGAAAPTAVPFIGTSSLFNISTSIDSYTVIGQGTPDSTTLFLNPTLPANVGNFYTTISTVKANIDATNGDKVGLYGAAINTAGGCTCNLWGANTIAIRASGCPDVNYNGFEIDVSNNAAPSWSAPYVGGLVLANGGTYNTNYGIILHYVSGSGSSFGNGYVEEARKCYQWR